jgi:hypothetical protein
MTTYLVFSSTESTVAMTIVPGWMSSPGKAALANQDSRAVPRIGEPQERPVALAPV